MNVIKPTTITTAKLTASNVAETDYAEWNVATPYAEDAYCIVAAQHKIYQALTAVTGGSSPEIDVLAAVPKWQQISATNRWKAFDGKVGSQTTNADSITYSITLSNGDDSIALFNMDALSVELTITKSAVQVYHELIDLNDTSVVFDWYAYFFEEFEIATDIVRTNFPAELSGATLDIVITNTGGTAKVGEIVVGQNTSLGTTRPDIGISINDYSVKTVDAFGNYSVLERAYSWKLNCDITINNSILDEVFDFFAAYRSTPLVWIASSLYSSTVIYGFYKDCPISLTYADISECSLEIEGLV